MIPRRPAISLACLALCLSLAAPARADLEYYDFLAGPGDGTTTLGLDGSLSGSAPIAGLTRHDVLGNPTGSLAITNGRLDFTLGQADEVDANGDIHYAFGGSGVLMGSILGGPVEALLRIDHINGTLLINEGGQISWLLDNPVVEGFFADDLARNYGFGPGTGFLGTLGGFVNVGVGETGTIPAGRFQLELTPLIFGTPEPASAAMLAMGGLAVAGWMGVRRRRAGRAD